MEVPVPSDKFVGKSKKDAQNLAEVHNLIFRLVSVDGKSILGYPADDKREDRICVELHQSKVVKAIYQ